MVTADVLTIQRILLFRVEGGTSCDNAIVGDSICAGGVEKIGAVVHNRIFV